MNFFIFLFCFLLSTSLHALYNGNPSFPTMPEQGIWSETEQWWGVKIGYQGDYIWNKKLKFHKGKEGDGEFFGALCTMKNEGVLTYNIIDRLEFFGSAGSMEAKISAHPDRMKIKYKTDAGLVLGIGGRVILFYSKKILMGVNAKYTTSCLSINQTILNGVEQKRKGHFTYNEWQLGFGFSREIDSFIPYLGLAYASMRGHFHHTPFISKNEIAKAKEHFILFLGAGITNGLILDLNVEVRMIGEKAVSLSIDLRL